MEFIKTTSWEEFLAKATAIRALVAKQQGQFAWSPVLFRGQANAEWGLTSTLERYVKSPMPMEQYYQAIQRIKHSIETFTDTSWNVNFSEAFKWCSNMPFREPPGYEYMAFLRHHGFPSPLLDWSASEAIAAFFAFREASSEDVDEVAVYAYCDTISGAKAGSSDWPLISYFGPTIKTHERHLLQQCHYTMCTVFKRPELKLTFVPHDEVHKYAEGNNSYVVDGQSQLWKITIPASERGKALTHLYKYNLHAFSLFNSTEALAEKLAFEHLGPYDLASYLGAEDQTSA